MTLFIETYIYFLGNLSRSGLWVVLNSGGLVMLVFKLKIF